MTTKLSAVACALLALGSPSASANVFDTYGQSASTMAIGNATTAGGDDAFTAYSNPAFLAGSEKSQFSIQAIGVKFDLETLPAAAGSRLPPANDDQPSEIQGASLGINLALRKDVHLGLAAYMPQGNFGRIKGGSPYQPTYLRFSEQQQKPALYTAIGAEGPWGIGIGLGAYYTLKAKGVLQVSLSDQESEGRLDLVMEPVVVGFGALKWSSEEFAVGLYYRDAQQTESKVDSAFAFSTEDAILPFDANTSLVPFYDPALVRLGFALNMDAVRVLFSWEQAMWSDYKAPLVNLSGNDVAAISAEAARSDAGLRDTNAYRIGLIVPLKTESEISLRAGFEVHTSANKSSTKSNVIDPSRDSVAFGGTWKLAADKQGRRLALEGALQYSRLGELNVITPKGASVNLDADNSIMTLIGGLQYEL